jgi:hypothetical protein
MVPRCGSGDEPFVGDEEQRHRRCFINASALGFNDAVFNLVGHSQAMPAANGVGFEHHVDLIRECLSVDGDRQSFIEADAYFFGRDRNYRRARMRLP